MGLRDHYPASAKVFDEMAEEEVRHRTMLIELYQKKFGEYLPLIRRQDVKGFIKLKPLWLAPHLSLEETRKYAEQMEFEAERFYRKAADIGARRIRPQAVDGTRRDRSPARESRAQARRAGQQVRPAPAKRKWRGACSCCNTCSRAWPG